jgi:hypothetical protein
VRIFAYVNGMCGALSIVFSEIWCDNSTTTCCRGAASGKLCLTIIYQIPPIDHRYFQKCGAPDDGSNDLRSIDIPIENFISISVGSVLREWQWCTLQYEFWLASVKYDKFRTWPHVNGLCVVFPDRIDNGASNWRQLHIRRALQAEHLYLIDFGCP